MRPLTPEELQAKVSEFALEFDQRTTERHVMGAEKYGPGTWMTIDNLEHAIAEVLDLGNYILYTYIKLRLLQEGVARTIEEGSKIIARAQPGMEMLGKHGFMSSSGKES